MPFLANSWQYNFFFDPDTDLILQTIKIVYNRVVPIVWLLSSYTYVNIDLVLLVLKFC